MTSEKSKLSEILESLSEAEALLLEIKSSVPIVAQALLAARSHIVTLGGEPDADGDAIQHAVLMQIDAALREVGEGCEAHPENEPGPN